MLAVLIVFHVANEKKGIWWKWYQNEKTNRQRWDSVTVRNLKAREITTTASLSIHWAHCRSAVASVVVFNPLDTSSIVHWCICCRCCSIRAHLLPPTPPLSSYVPWACHLAPAASVIVSDPLDALRIPRPLPTPPSLSLSLLDCLTFPTLPLLSSIPLYRKHTGASAVGDIKSDRLYLLLPQLNPPFLSSRPWAAHKHTGTSAVEDVKSDALYFLIPELTPLL